MFQKREDGLLYFSEELEQIFLEKTIETIALLKSKLLKKKSRILYSDDANIEPLIEDLSLEVAFKTIFFLVAEARGVFILSKPGFFERAKAFKKLLSEHPLFNVKNYRTSSILDGTLEDAFKILTSKKLESLDYSLIPIEKIGHLYEKVLGTIGKRKDKGSFYTPKWVINEMVEHAIKPIINLKIAKAKTENVNVLEKVLEIKILDPAMGCGHFLLEPINYISNVLVELAEISAEDVETLRKDIFINCIHGVEHDPTTASISKIIFWLIIGPKRLTPKQIINNLKLGNTLVNLNFEEEFPTILNSEEINPGFDIVIGNPPWGIRIKEKDRRALQEKYPQVNDYESFQYFAVKSIELLKQGGIHSFIVPNTFALNVLATRFRKWMLSQGSMISMRDYSEYPIFEDPGVRCLIYFLEKSKLKKECRIEIIKSVENVVSRTVSHQKLLRAKDWTIFLKADPKMYDIIEKIKQKSINLDKITTSKQGYIPYRFTTLKKRFGEEKAKKIRDNREWHSESKVDEDYKRELQGSDVLRYEVRWSGTWVKYGPWVSTYVDMKFFKAPRLLFREITRGLPYSINVAFSREEYVNNPSIITAIKRNETQYPNYTLQAALALLNGILISIYFMNTAPKARKGLFPKIIVRDVRRLPIYRFDFSMDGKTKADYLKKLNELEEIYFSSGDSSDLLRFIKQIPIHHNEVLHDYLHHISDTISYLLTIKMELALGKDEYEGYIHKVQKLNYLVDQISYILYDLTEEEIERVELLRR